MKIGKIVGIQILIVLLLLTGCAGKQQTDSKTVPVETSAYKITVHGLGNKDITLAQKDLMQLPTVTQHAEAIRANGEKIKVEATGPLLDEFLKKYGKKQTDFARVRFTARDGYSIAVPHDILVNRPVILSYINDGKPLIADDEPIRVVVPGERAMYWVRKMVRIDFETDASTAAVSKVLVLDTAVKTLKQEDYKYYGSTDKAVKLSELSAKYSGGKFDNVFLKAGDGLQKNETAANFMRAYMKFTGTDAPKFCAPDFPQGMQIKDILHISYGDTMLYSVGEALKVQAKADKNADQSVKFSDLLRETSLRGGLKYQFTNLSGSKVTINTTDMIDGKIVMTKDGSISFSCSDKGAEKRIDHLLLIESLK